MIIMGIWRVNECTRLHNLVARNILVFKHVHVGVADFGPTKCKASWIWVVHGIVSAVAKRWFLDAHSGMV
eukprot:1160469-Pelagomonas_calceolata.AAC.2